MADPAVSALVARLESKAVVLEQMRHLSFTAEVAALLREAASRLSSDAAYYEASDYTRRQMADRLSSEGRSEDECLYCQSPVEDNSPDLGVGPFCLKCAAALIGNILDRYREGYKAGAADARARLSAASRPELTSDRCRQIVKAVCDAGREAFFKSQHAGLDDHECEAAQTLAEANMLQDELAAAASRPAPFEPHPDGPLWWRKLLDLDGPTGQCERVGAFLRQYSAMLRRNHPWDVPETMARCMEVIASWAEGSASRPAPTCATCKGAAEFRAWLVARQHVGHTSDWFTGNQLTAVLSMFDQLCLPAPPGPVAQEKEK